MFDLLKNRLSLMLSPSPAPAMPVGAASSTAANDPASILGNPLRSLKPDNAASMLERFIRGEYTNAQWLFTFVEKQDADVIALSDRRVSSVQELAWGVNINEPLAERLKLDSLAEEQKAALQERYDRIGNQIGRAHV